LVLHDLHEDNPQGPSAFAPFVKGKSFGVLGLVVVPGFCSRRAWRQRQKFIDNARSISGARPFYITTRLIVDAPLSAVRYSSSPLAETDFTSALALAQSIVRPETSIAGQLGARLGVRCQTELSEEVSHFTFWAFW